MDEKLEEFKQLVKSHDLTHIYSDDGAAYRRGHDELMKIRAMAKELPQDQVKAIWDANVDLRMAAGYREQFYWK